MLVWSLLWLLLLELWPLQESRIGGEGQSQWAVCAKYTLVQGVALSIPKSRLPSTPHKLISTNCKALTFTLSLYLQ